MKKPSSDEASRRNLREKLLGLGDDSLRKSYYPELQKQLDILGEQVELARLVAEIARGLAEEGDLRSSLQRCSDALVRHTDAVFARIWTTSPDEKTLELQASSGLHTSITGKSSRIDIRSYPYKIGCIARNRTPLLSNDVVGNHLFHDQDWVAKNRIVAFAGFPLLLDQRLVGVVAMFSQKALNETVLATFSTIVSQIAVGIERKKSAIELANYKDRLELIVQERTRQLQEAQSELLQAERLATLGRLTATVSHELRNPLGTIQTALYAIGEGLQRQDLSHTARALELADRNILRCVNIIEDLTDFTRIKKLTIKSLLLDEWMMSLIDELNIPDDVALQLSAGCQQPVQADPERLRQVMVNIIGNALDALQKSESAGKVLHVSTRLGDGHYDIRVSDNGIGMSAETLGKVFEPLYSTKGFGVGLGMVIVKNIVERHHGQIFIDSQEGAGTTVTLRLPVLVSIK